MTEHDKIIKSVWHKASIKINDTVKVPLWEQICSQVSEKVMHQIRDQLRYKVSEQVKNQCKNPIWGQIINPL